MNFCFFLLFLFSFSSFLINYGLTKKKGQICSQCQSNRSLSRCQKRNWLLFINKWDFPFLFLTFTSAHTTHTSIAFLLSVSYEKSPSNVNIDEHSIRTTTCLVLWSRIFFFFIFLMCICAREIMSSERHWQLKKKERKKKREDTHTHTHMYTRFY